MNKTILGVIALTALSLATVANADGPRNPGAFKGAITGAAISKGISGAPQEEAIEEGAAIGMKASHSVIFKD